jgi:hypothetical protein
MKLYYPQTFYSNVYVDIPESHMKFVIGKNGSCFKKISEQCKVNYIWYNKKRHIVQIWGPVGHLMSAHYCVLSRIKYVKKMLEINNSSVGESGDAFIATEEVVVSKWEADEMIELDLYDKIPNVTDVKYLIGRNGCFFKHVTKESGASFIWYNSHTHAIQIWGILDDIRIAMEMIQNKLTSVLIPNN